MKKVTIKDVAKEANVSISVVSYVLNNTKGISIRDETKEKVREAAKKLNYVSNRIARGLREQKSKCIGVVPYWDFDISIFMEMLDGINREALANGYRIILCSAGGSEDFDYLDCFHEKIIDGVIFIAPHEGSRVVDETVHIRTMQKNNVPFTLINGHTNIEDVSYININFYESTFIATRALIEKGYREITYVTPESDYFEIRERLRGYQETMRQAGLDVQICYAEQVADKIKTFRAVVTNKSDTAHMVMKEAIKQGLRIPEDFVLIAGNTEEYCDYLFPSLSSVKIPAREIGSAAAGLLIDLLSNKNEFQLPEFKCSIQYRQSMR